MKELENFLPINNVVLYLLILIISFYFLFRMNFPTIEKEKDKINIEVLLKMNIEYLKKFYNRYGETDKWKDMDNLIINYQNLNFESIDIVETIENIADRYEEIGNNIGCLNLHYQIIKIKKKIEPENKTSIISTWEKIMLLNSYIENKNEARKIFLYIQSLRRYQKPGKTYIH